MIVAEDVWFTYPNGVVALRGISLKIEEGTTTALIGQNGSGKTTLAKMTNGLLKPTKGRVLVDGVDTAKKRTYELARTVGYSFQNPTRQLYTTSVRAELMAGPLNLGLGRGEAESRAEAALDLFGLRGLEEARPSSLPFPTKKLVGIASVYTMRPKAMVLDEPTTGQDHVGLTMVQNSIRKIREMGLTVVVITHDMRLVAESADRVAVMAMGELVRVGTPLEIFTDEAAMAKAALRPPQVVELSSRLEAALPGHGGLSRTVEEEVRKVRAVAGGSAS